MVRVKIFFKGGKTKTANFPEASLRAVRSSAPRINPKISRVEYYRPKRKTASWSNFGSFRL